MDALWIRLPESARLPHGNRLTRLPLVESTAAGLTDALLTREPVARQRRLSSLLEADPWLLLWAVLRVGPEAAAETALFQQTGDAEAAQTKSGKAETSEFQSDGATGSWTIEHVASRLAGSLFDQLLADLTVSRQAATVCDEAALSASTSVGGAKRSATPADPRRAEGDGESGGEKEFPKAYRPPKRLAESVGKARMLAEVAAALADHLPNDQQQRVDANEARLFALLLPCSEWLQPIVAGNGGQQSETPEIAADPAAWRHLWQIARAVLGDEVDGDGSGSVREGQDGGSPGDTNRANRGGIANDAATEGTAGVGAARLAEDDRWKLLVGRLRQARRAVEEARRKPRTRDAVASPEKVAREGRNDRRSSMPDLPWDAIRRRVGQQQRAWLRPCEGATHRLEQLLLMLDRLRRLETRFDEQLETEKLEAMAELAAGAGHEINPPLAIISGRAQLFLRDEHDPQRRRELATINRQAIRVHEMIADMMLFARPEPPEPEPVELAAFLAEQAQSWRVEGTQRHIEVQMGPIASGVVVWADRVQLAVALRAVVTNAFEALGDGGYVAIEARRATRRHVPAPGGYRSIGQEQKVESVPRTDDQQPMPQASGSDRSGADWSHENRVSPATAPAAETDGRGMAEIAVRDNGPGIPDEVRRHLFDPFYSGRAAGRGLGLGLSKCWRIVTNHGGRVEVDSDPCSGTTLRLLLPLAAH